jgi:hypothetical protein
MNYAETVARCDARIPWSMWTAQQRFPDVAITDAAAYWPFSSERHEYWGPRAKWLLGSWLEQLDLNRGDVITVLTTSQEQYVALDVSVTSFNFASVSRVVSDRTRVIVVIHELGYVDAAFPVQCEEWRARGITVMEDCAHVAGVALGTAHVGDYGDAALFSLSKVIPARVGGLIRTRKPFKLAPMSEAMSSDTAEGRLAAQAAFPRLGQINLLRTERHQLLRSGLDLPPWEPRKPTVSAPLYSIYDDREGRINKAEAPDVDWGTTTIEVGRIQIPTNPLVPLSQFEALVTHFRR